GGSAGVVFGQAEDVIRQWWVGGVEDGPAPVLAVGNRRVDRAGQVHEERFVRFVEQVALHCDGDRLAGFARQERQHAVGRDVVQRSEERRVGKGGSCRGGLEL